MKRVLILALAVVALATVAVSTASAAPVTGDGAIIIHKRIWDPNVDGSGSWKPAAPAHRWNFKVTNNANGTVIANPTDEDHTPVDASKTYVITEVVSAGFQLKDFIRSTNGGSSCPDPAAVGGATQVTVTPADLASGTVHLCAYNKATAPTQPSRVVKEFYQQTNDYIVWKLSPVTNESYLVNDPSAAKCEAQGGSACGAIASGGKGQFAANTPGQYLLIFQSYAISGGSCEVPNTAKWSTASGSGQVTATFRCSGATALGWPLLAVVFIAATGVAYTAHRSRQWKR